MPTGVHMFMYIAGSDLDNEFIQCPNSTLLCGDKLRTYYVSSRIIQLKWRKDAVDPCLCNIVPLC